MSVNVIEQASAIPFAWRENRLEFCLITSIGSRRWGFPKGIIDPGERPPETALKEAEEEAGLVGEIVGEPVGDYTYSKWNSKLNVTVFTMRVTAIHNDWDEADLRDRRWCTADEARELIDRQKLLRLLDAAIDRIDAMR